MERGDKMQKSYSRERKLLVVKWHHDNNRKVYFTADHFKVDRKIAKQWWVRDEERTQKQRKFVLNIFGNYINRCEKIGEESYVSFDDSSASSVVPWSENEW